MADEKPSHHAIDNGNPAVFKPTYFVLDDINIDLLTFFAAIASLLSISYLKLPSLFVLPAAGLCVLPLRLFFPRGPKPTGLALVTGASSGIGAELCYILASKGHDLILVGRDESQLAAVRANIATKFHRNAHIIATDLSVPGSAQKLYDDVTSAGHDVSILVNCAGLGAAGDVLSQPVDLVERMTVLNCITPVQLTQLFGRAMAARGRGWILQVSSIGGWMASPYQAVYHATKHFTREFAEAMAVELRAYPGVVQTQLMPGPTKTQFITRSKADETLMMNSPSVEDAHAVAAAGYDGLVRRKRMVYSSWNAAWTATVMRYLPRSLHLTLGALANSPLRGVVKQRDVREDQREAFGGGGQNGSSGVDGKVEGRSFAEVVKE